IRSGWPFAMSVGYHDRIIAISSNACVRSRQSTTVVKPTFPARPSGPGSPTSTSRAGSANGNGRSSTALTTLKIAAFAPMPSGGARRVDVERFEPGADERPEIDVVDVVGLTHG